jgi:hypothetical protein
MLKKQTAVEITAYLSHGGAKYIILPLLPVRGNTRNARIPGGEVVFRRNCCTVPAASVLTRHGRGVDFYGPWMCVVLVEVSYP